MSESEFADFSGEDLTEPGAGHLSGTGVHAKFELLGVEIIGNRFQASWELAELRLELAIAVSTVDILPAVIEHDIVVSQVTQTQAQDLRRGTKEKVFGNVATESIPVVLF